MVLDALFLTLCWAWIASAVLLLRRTVPHRTPLGASPATYGLPCESIRFQAVDGIWLSGWKIPADPQKPWLILCHGLGANRAALLEIAGGFSRVGYNLLLFDFRGHGESRGRITSFGWREQLDLEGALAFLGRQPEVPDRPYGILGLSMGGAVASLVASRDERLAAIAIDSTFTDLETSIGLSMWQWYHLPSVPFRLFACSAYRIRFGVWPSKLRPLEAVQSIAPRALLVIHGEHDQRIPVTHARALFAAAHEPRRLRIVVGAGHLEASRNDPEGYLEALLGFFERSLP